MGHRADIAVQDIGQRVYLYTHNGAERTPAVVAQTLTDGKTRWTDPSYLTRMAFCRLVPASDLMGETGFGISLYPSGDTQRPLIVINCDTQRVAVELNVTNLEWEFHEFAALTDLSWESLLEVAASRQVMQKITTHDGREIDSKVFTVGQSIEHNGQPVIVIEPNAPGHAPGHVTLRSERDDIQFVAWANYCNAQ